MTLNKNYNIKRICFYAEELEALIKHLEKQGKDVTKYTFMDLFEEANKNQGCKYLG